MPTAYYDGRYLDPAEIKISPLDYGFSRGVTVFELTRLYGGVPFRLEDHCERFLRGAQKLGIACPLSPDELTHVVSRLAAANNYAHSVVKFYLTAGECRAPGFVFSQDSDFTPHFMALEQEVKPQHPEAPKGLELYRRGIVLRCVPFSRDLEDVKSINYAPGFVAARAAAGPDCDEILLTHPDGVITETTTGNFFCVLDGVLCTPKRGILHGITRKVLLELAPGAGIRTNECDLTPQDLTRATEAFITGSLAEMVPVRAIDGAAYATTMDGPVFGKLRKALSAEIAKCCGAKAKAA